MFYDPVEYGRKADDMLWRRVYYDVIQLTKQNKKVSVLLNTWALAYFGNLFVVVLLLFFFCNCTCIAC